VKQWWHWVRDSTEAEDDDTYERTLYLVGEICPYETWFDDAVTPEAFKAELNSAKGPVTVYIDSPGGDVFAAAQIYNALREYKGAVTVHIGSLAASAASVIAMAGRQVLISPVGLFLIHNPMLLAAGDSAEMRRAAELLDSVKESIINAYQLRTGMSRKRLSEMMDKNVPFDAKETVSLGFADGMLYENRKADAVSGVAAIFNTLPDISAITSALAKVSDGAPAVDGIPAESLEKRLQLITH